jgi:predicted dinucleotide-binding enzyme
MKIAVLGTGMVGRALAGRFADLGHDVIVGTRVVEETLSRTLQDAKGSAPYAEWQNAHPAVRLAAFPAAGAHAEVLVNATAGLSALPMLELVGIDNLAGKVLVDLAVPLDYSRGRPPRLAFGTDDSLGERIQRAFPEVRVVKTLNTMHVNVMVDPARVPGRHNVFLSGDHDEAKDIVANLLAEFGWPRDAMIDLGGIQSARATELYAPLLFSLMASLATTDVNIGVARP